MQFEIMWVATACVGPATSTRHAEIDTKKPLNKTGFVPTNPLEHLKHKCQDELAEVRNALMNRDLTMVQSSVDMIRKIGTMDVRPLSQISRDSKNLLVREKELEATISSIARLDARKRHMRIRTESRVMLSEPSTGPISSSATATHENLSDIMGNEDTKVGTGSQAASTAGQTNTLDMTNFLSRPVPLDTFDLVIGTALDFSIDVWDAWASQPSVRAKLRNYAYLKGNLNVKIAISGSPFHYGKILVSYQPYSNRNTILQANITNYAAEAGYRNLFLNYLSQAPEAAVMDVKDNTPLTVVCPFISPKPMYRLFNPATTVISDATSFTDLADAGTLYMYGISAPGSVSTSPSSISVYIYAWMTEVELGAPTGTQIAITTESRVIDERETGPVERLMTTASDAASALTTVPALSVAAKASSMMFGGMAKFASLLGWSVPPLLNETSYVKNQPYMNGAQVIGTFSGQRLTLDPKQEITVDPRDAGVADDELAINAISKVQTYLRTFTWSTDDPPLAGNIFISPVTPNLNTVFEKLTDYWIQPTAMAYANAPFKFWRGTIHFRFEIVVSQFHRGKLAFYYEPNCYQHALIDANLDTNKQFVKVVDIQETQMVEFSIGWAFHRDWCMNDGDFSTYPYLVNLEDFADIANGFIAVVPFTAIQSPDDSDVTINVYVSCPDLQVNALTAESLPTSRITTESRTITHDTPHTVMPLNESTATTSGIAERHFGEQPLSFRALLKRFVTRHELTVVGINFQATTFSAIAPIYPSIAPQVGSSSITYPELYSYLRYAFLGLRGGMRYRYTFAGGIGDNIMDDTVVTLNQPTNVWTTPSVSSTGSSASNFSKLDGSLKFVMRTNSGVEFELPFYSSNRFLFSFADDLIGTNGVDEVAETFHRNFAVRVTKSTTTTAATFHKFDMATGEDFTFIRFQGAPYYVL